VNFIFKVKDHQAATSKA